MSLYSGCPVLIERRRSLLRSSACKGETLACERGGQKKSAIQRPLRSGELVDQREASREGGLGRSVGPLYCPVGRFAAGTWRARGGCSLFFVPASLPDGAQANFYFGCFPSRPGLESYTTQNRWQEDAISIGEAHTSSEFLRGSSSSLAFFTAKRHKERRGNEESPDSLRKLC